MNNKNILTAVLVLVIGILIGFLIKSPNVSTQNQNGAAAGTATLSTPSATNTIKLLGLINTATIYPNIPKSYFCTTQIPGTKLTVTGLFSNGTSGTCMALRTLPQLTNVVGSNPLVPQPDPNQISCIHQKEVCYDVTNQICDQWNEARFCIHYYTYVVTKCDLICMDDGISY